MDLEETVKEIKFDLRNVKELLSYLTENVKALKLGRDEDLHGKLDELLIQKENQKEIEKKIDSSREEVKKVAEEIRNSEEIKYLKDSVETCVGYQELFVKDFEKIHKKIQKIDAKFDNLEQTLQEGARETGNIKNAIKNFTTKVENFEKNLKGITENGPKLFVYGEKIEKLEQGLKEKIDLIWKTLEEMKKNLEMEVRTVILASNERKREIIAKLAEINKKVQTIPETNLKCCNPRCHSILPKNLHLREDGVSVQCNNCSCANVVEKLKEEHKWMYMLCNGFHFQQFHVDKKHGEKGKCQVCGKEGEIYGAKDWIAVS